MSPQLHDVLPTYRTAHSPDMAHADVQNCSTTARGMRLTKFYMLLASFFRRFTLLSSRHCNILRNFANHHGSHSSPHATATSRALDALPTPPHRGVA
ncbi:hypothetical protein JB92DRAFT_3137794 [Gautieria morchelliformis]|nr:hypothetical protein JB92DRAFT_3137794 [Gautieria morchelliformis]